MSLPGEGGLRIGSNVRAARRSRGMSLEALAGLTGRSKGWLSKVENGRARLERRQTERTEINERLAVLGRATGQRDEPGLLDALPMLGDALPGMPASIQARLFAAFGLELIYNKQDHQVTIYATITPSTPQALADIIATSEPPAAPGELALSLHHPRWCW